MEIVLGLLIVLFALLYNFIKQESPKEVKKSIQNNATSGLIKSNVIKIEKIKKEKRFEDFNMNYGYVKSSNTPDSVLDFVDWYLINNIMLTEYESLYFEEKTFLGYPSATHMYLEESKVYFLDANESIIGSYDIGFENEELIVNTDQGTYYIEIDHDESLQNLRIELGETNSVIVYNNSTNEFYELENNQKPYYMQEHTINEDEIYDAEFDDTLNSKPDEVINEALSVGIINEEITISKQEMEEERYSSENVNSSTNY